MPFEIDKSWTLFLDRDGVINEKRENDYVKNWDEFRFLEGALEALSLLSSMFTRIIVVTNQRGVGKGMMTVNDLNNIHKIMMDLVLKNSGRIDKIYFWRIRILIDNCKFYKFLVIKKSCPWYIVINNS